MISRSMIGILVGATGTVGIVGGGGYKVYTVVNTKTPKSVEDRKHNIKTNIKKIDYYSMNGSKKAYGLSVNGRQYKFFDFTNGTVNTTSPNTSPCPQKYCEGTWDMTNPPSDVWFDHNKQFIFAWKQGQNDVNLPMEKSNNENAYLDLIADIEIFIEDYSGDKK